MITSLKNNMITIDNGRHGKNSPILIKDHRINRFILDDGKVRSKVTFFLCDGNNSCWLSWWSYLMSKNHRVKLHHLDSCKLTILKTHTIISYSNHMAILYLVQGFKLNHFWRESLICEWSFNGIQIMCANSNQASLSTIAINHRKYDKTAD